jgi:hypothetical protein
MDLTCDRCGFIGGKFDTRWSPGTADSGHVGELVCEDCLTDDEQERYSAAHARVKPIRHPEDGQGLDLYDASTWFCFDCKTRDSESFFELDGYVRCLDCRARWGEQHLDVEEWR